MIFPAEIPSGKRTESIGQIPSFEVKRDKEHTFFDGTKVIVNLTAICRHDVTPGTWNRRRYKHLHPSKYSYRETT